jgi:hypothetical protein
MYWSGGSLNSLVICSNEVTVGTTGPMGSGLPQFGFPRRFAIDFLVLERRIFGDDPRLGWGVRKDPRNASIVILGIFYSKIKSKEQFGGR